jgi:hypothetical protein
MSRSVALAPLSLLILIGGQACGPSVEDDEGGSGGQGGSDPGPVVTVLTPDAPPLPGFDTCEVEIVTGLPLEGKTHVDVCTDVAYGTNPPSSGDHWPIWAQYRAHDIVVPRMMWVHNLEHGAIVMAHACDEACTTEARATFETVAESFGVDEKCAASPTPQRSRILVTEDPDLDRPIALAAWRATYRATCLDEASLRDFVEAHYGNGLEATCAPGKDPGDPATGVPACD